MSQTPVKSDRLQFIDALRAYAILMMLQGHFVDMMLASEYRDTAYPLYDLWSFMRGMTAPIFFTITGIVFVFLLLRKGLPLGENPRIRKGLKRGVQLIGIGYLIQLSIPAILSFHWYKSFWEVDVLHCIGLALIALIGLYALCEKLRLPIPLVFTVVALTLFLVEPITKAVDWSFFPRFFEHYFTKEFGSNFTPIPWVGYTLIGGVIGWHVSRDQGLYRTAWWPLFFVILGWLLVDYSSPLLIEVYKSTGWTVFRQVAYNNYLLIRLGHVFIVISVFMWLELIFKQFPRLLLKIGGETLTVYAVHFVVLYGTWFGIGVSTFWKYSLSPWTVAIGAALFVAAHVLLVAKLEEVTAFLKVKMWQPIRRSYRMARIALLRSGREWPRQVVYTMENIWGQIQAFLPLSRAKVK